MHEYGLQMGSGLTMNIACTSPLFAEERARLMAGAYLPSVQFLDGPAEKPHLKLTVVPVSAGGGKLRSSHNEIVVYQPRGSADDHCPGG